jgi:hypothetical protein
MAFYRTLLRFFFLAGIILSMCSTLCAQTDTIPKESEARKSFLNQMINNFKRKDTTEVDVANELKRNDEAYNQFANLIIRNILIKKVPFGIAFADSTKKFKNKLTSLANSLHHITKTRVVENNLFFRKNDALKPYLMADNERFLRQLPYLQDAGFTIVPVTGTDSVDVIVAVKDVFSLGGAIGSLGLKQSQVQAREDNFAGSGNAAVGYTLYDIKRRSAVALGGEYNPRNIGGSFIDGAIGYQSFYPSISGPNQDNIYYMKLVKPLINRYMRWTYEFDAAYHATKNMYNSDSIYFSDYRYRYSNIEAWAGYNIHSKDFTPKQESDKLRKLIGVRFIRRKFERLPDQYQSVYNWQYADLTGLLATVTFYRQNFYKTQYIYGFGRNEDIPEGLLFSVTSGYTIKQGRSRSFIGLNYERSHFNKRNNYISYTLRGEGFLNHTSIEDINLLGEVNYFDHLKQMGPNWKQRFFLDLGVAHQVNTILNEPLFVKSQFGLPEYGSNKLLGGTMRATAKAESVFFSPWSLVSFKFAPFVFSNVSLFSPYLSNARLLSSVGAGLRTRNESFVFGTIEVKGYYFPQKNFHNEKFGLEISTNVIFKYNSQFVQKPDFIQVN